MTRKPGLRFHFSLLSVLVLALNGQASAPLAGRLLNPKNSATNHCADRPGFMSEVRPEIAGGLESLPKVVLVARDAEVWVEGQAGQSGVRVHAYQSFLRPQKKNSGKVLCAQSPEGFRDRFSMLAPTLIDLSAGKKVGHSFWQFQVVAENQKFSAWNHKSSVIEKDGDLISILKRNKIPYRFFQVGHNEYELLMQQEASGLLQTLSVRYEALR